MAVEIGQIYKCEKCGNIVEIVHGGAGTLICCNEPMRLLVENTTDAAQEKHVPVVTATAEGCRVAVGSVPHPMTEEHYIEWIEVTTAEGQTYRQYLQPGQEPVASFCLSAAAVVAREYCNLHGLWKGSA